MKLEIDAKLLIIHWAVTSYISRMHYLHFYRQESFAL